MMTEIKVAIENHLTNELNSSKNLVFSKLIPLNRVLIDTGASRTIISKHAVPAELFEYRRAAKETV